MLAIMSMFRGTVGFYRQYRPGVPESVADILDAAVPKTTPRRLLDLGTGTGLVVQALLGRFDDIIAIDSDADMLAAAEAAILPQLPGGARLLLAQVAAEAFAAPQGWQADLVTICRAFHWLDQARVLARLDSQVSAAGAVAIFSDNSFWAATNPWKVAVRSLVQEFLGPERRAGTSTFQHHNRPYSDVLRASPFAEVDEMIVPITRTWTADSILGYLHSTSFAAPQLFGDRLDELHRKVRAALRNFSETDTYLEENEFLIRIGRRRRA